jgi:hypothetical protein
MSFFTTDDSEKDWKYDEKSHKHDRKTIYDVVHESELENIQQKLDNNRHGKLKKELERELEEDVKVKARTN